MISPVEGQLCVTNIDMSHDIVVHVDSWSHIFYVLFMEVGMAVPKSKGTRVVW